MYLKNVMCQLCVRVCGGYVPLILENGKMEHFHATHYFQTKLNTGAQKSFRKEKKVIEPILNEIDIKSVFTKSNLPVCEYFVNRMQDVPVPANIVMRLL